MLHFDIMEFSRLRLVPLSGTCKTTCGNWLSREEEEEEEAQ